MFHFEISGNSSKEEHPANKPYIFITFFVFHLEISGKEFKEEHPANRQHKSTLGSITFFIFDSKSDLNIGLIFNLLKLSRRLLKLIYFFNNS